jgi:hypothetical protein
MQNLMCNLLRKHKYLDKISLIKRKDGKIRLALNFHQLAIYFSKNVKNECFKRFSITGFFVTVQSIVRVS